MRHSSSVSMTPPMPPLSSSINAHTQTKHTFSIHTHKHKHTHTHTHTHLQHGIQHAHGIQHTQYTCMCAHTLIAGLSFGLSLSPSLPVFLPSSPLPCLCYARHHS